MTSRSPPKINPSHRCCLIRQIRSTSRRAEMSASIYCFDGFRLDTGRRQLLDPNGVEVKLTSHEIDVLVKFCQNPQQLLTRDQLTPRLNARILSFERAVDV